jgi:predicted N-acetyltransferase YhbS
MDDVQIEPLRPEKHSEAVDVLSRAFATNPINMAAFGAEVSVKNAAFFRIGLSVMRGQKFVATGNGRILGLIHWVDSPACQFSGMEKLRMTPAMISKFGLRSALRVGSWLSAWEQRDPAEPHSHLGPIGVDPEAQGRGIGRRLMEHYCEHLDQTHKLGYLETDRLGNVAFYRRFGFETVQEAPVLGVPNYFMRRPVKKSAR